VFHEHFPWSKSGRMMRKQARFAHAYEGQFNISTGHMFIYAMWE
jgi:hypothetical protein